MQPPPGEFSHGKTAAGSRVAPIVAESERLEEGCRVELAVRDFGQRGICMGRAPDERRLIAMPGGRRVHVKLSKIKPAGDLDAEIVLREETSAVPLKGRDDSPSRAMLEAHILTHLRREISVQPREKSEMRKWTFSPFLCCCLVSRGTCQGQRSARHGYCVRWI